MLVIGLTGQTGAGKGTVSEKLKKHGFYHIDADKIAHSVYEKGSQTLNKLVAEFGSEILNSDKSLNRKILAEKAFATTENTLKLNTVVHPAVTEKIREIIKLQKIQNCKAVIIDAIALFESGENSLCDFTVAVTAPAEIRRERIMKRDCITKDEADLRINAQKDESFYKERADIIIENFPPYNLDDEVNKILLWINK